MAGKQNAPIDAIVATKVTSWVHAQASLHSTIEVSTLGFFSGVAVGVASDLAMQLLLSPESQTVTQGTCYGIASACLTLLSWLLIRMAGLAEALRSQPSIGAREIVGELVLLEGFDTTDAKSLDRVQAEAAGGIAATITRRYDRFRTLSIVFLILSVALIVSGGVARMLQSHP